MSHSLRFPFCVSVPILLLCLCLLSSRPASAQITELLTNGGFETGDFTGWTRQSRPLGTNYGDPSDPNRPASAGDYFIQGNSGTPPVSSYFGTQTLAPKSGSSYAISDMTAAGTHSLLQSFTVPSLAPGQSVIFSFDMYVYDFYGNGAAIDASGLDHTTGGTNQPNQHARVDLLRQSGTAFDTSGDAVVQNFYQGVDNPAGSTASPSYISYSFDLTNLVTAGETYQVRFATTDNQFVLNQGVDNVSVSVVPEPGTGALLLSSGVLTALRLRRGNRKRHQL